MNFMSTQDPKEQIREVQRKMREEQRRIDRDIREIAREEAKVKLEIKNLAKRGGYDSAIRSLAKELVGSKKAVAKLYMAKTQLNSISMQLRSQVNFLLLLLLLLLTCKNIIECTNKHDECFQIIHFRNENNE